MLVYFILVIKVAVVLCFDFEQAEKHYKCKEFDTSQKLWLDHRKSYESAVRLALKESYGKRTMNIYLKRTKDFWKLSSGFYLTDNIVHVLLINLQLLELPHLKMPNVVFALPSNVLQVDAGLSKMIIMAQYIVARNRSEMLFFEKNQDPYLYSPFSFQQVQSTGTLAITAEGCILVGFAIATLSGSSVNLGHDTFRVTDCKFSIEISTPDSKSPPVIAPYFSKEQSLQLEALLSRPIREELMPKLQGAMFSYVNTSSIFGEDLRDIRTNEQYAYVVVADRLSKMVRNLNKNAIEMTQDSKLEPLEISWDDKCGGKTCKSNIQLKDITLHGLDTAYSAHSGGHFKLNSVGVADALRFNSIKVRGKLLFQNETNKGDHIFVAEVLDVTVNMELQSIQKQSAHEDTATENSQFRFVGWRSMQFSILDLQMFGRERMISEAIVTGHLLNELPGHLINHLSGKSSGDIKLQGYVKDFERTSASDTDSVDAFSE